MDDLSKINWFIEVAKFESFTKAAQHLGVTSSAVSKQVQNLEQELRIKLLTRTTRKVSLTEEGSIFFEKASFALSLLDDAKSEIMDLHQSPRGSLKVTLPFSLGLHVLKKPIAQFCARYPEIKMDIQFEDKHVNIIEDGYDVALRIGNLKDSNLIAKRLAPINVHIFASPNYLKAHPPIKNPKDLVAHNVFEYAYRLTSNSWQYKDPLGNLGTVEFNSKLRSNSVVMMEEAALNHLGILMTPEIYIKKELENETLVKILPDYISMPERNLYAIYPSNRFICTRTQLFIQSMDDAIKGK